MYTVLVTAQVAERSSGTFTVPRDRYLEYTAEQIAVQLRFLSRDAMECFKSWPCLLMEEGRSDETAHIGRVTAISESMGSIQLVVDAVPLHEPLVNDTIWKMRDELDLGQFEFGRHHLAVKDRNLPDVLGRFGHALDPAAVAGFLNKPLPAPSRARLVASTERIAEWSHTQLDRFLMEAGVPGLSATRALGGRKDRANAIIAFAIANPNATTAENDLFSSLLVSRAEETRAADEPATPNTNTGDLETQQRGVRADSTSAVSPNRVFVVHGRNERARTELVSFLSEVGLHAVVLHEQANMGRHLLTKFIEEAELVTFAVVLMTDDDVGNAREGVSRPRARQNVILELGYFLSHLGQARVCAIVTPGLETPSDFDGIVYIAMDTQGSWKTQLLRELKAAQMPVQPGLAPGPRSVH